jgi:adenylyltransferase/sulfurtransferase
MKSIRYDRQIRLEGFGSKSQKLLEQARVLVVGAGGLGVPVGLYLNAMGVGTLGLVDADIVEESNLHRQPAYGPADIGKTKISVLGERLRQQNPDTKIELHKTFLQSNNALKLLEHYDLVIDATDRIATRYLLDDACVIRRIPWIYGALHGFEGQVSVFNYKGGPTYRCLFPRIPRQGEIPNCNQLGTLGILPGIIGNFQALEAVKVLCEIGEVLSGKLLLFSALDQQSRQIRFKKDETQAERVIQQDAHYAPEFCETGGSMSTREYRNLVKKGVPHILVDVRESWEFASNHLPSALNIPLLELDKEIVDLKSSEALYLICESGSRSAQAYQILKPLISDINLRWIRGGMREIRSDLA